MKRNVQLLLMFVCLFLIAGNTLADSWQTMAVGYLWGTGLDGKIAFNDRSVEVDQSFGDILSNLDFAFMGGVICRKGNWSIAGDLQYAALSSSGKIASGATIGVDVDQWIVGGDVGYRVAKDFDVLAGLRLVSVQNTLEFQGLLGGSPDLEFDKTWVDPVVGFRFTPEFNDKWSLLTRFDIGGFDVGSDITWQLNANILWHFSRNSSLGFGYRVIDIKYDDENQDNDFLFDVTTHGPIVGLAYTF